MMSNISSSNGPFQYKPLSFKFPEIRLVKFKPASDVRDPIHLELFHDDLAKPTDYSALSYTWGAPYKGCRWSGMIRTAKSQY